MKMLQDFTEEHLNICGWLMITLAVVSFISAFFLTTPYGRYSRQVWGFGIHAQAAWLLQECPSFIIPFALFMSSDGVRKLMTLDVSPNLVLLFMFLIHYFRRAFIYPFSIKTTAPTPFWIFVFALTFCTVNGFTQGHYHVYVGVYPKDWFYTWQFLLGSFLFVVGFAINIHSDYILTSLRKPGEIGYKIPQGGLFQYVSCANFFGEIVEWGGFALASSSFVAFAFFFNTIFQIGTRACHHHRFYQEKFEDYPSNRKAVIPFIF